MLWALQLLSAAVGVDCQEAKEGAESEPGTFLTGSDVLCYHNGGSIQQSVTLRNDDLPFLIDLGFLWHI